MNLISKGAYRIPLGIVLSILGSGVIASYYLNLISFSSLNPDMIMPLMGVSAFSTAIGLIGAFDGIFMRNGIRAKLKKISDEIFENLSEFLPPERAIETFDEVWFSRLTDMESICRKFTELAVRNYDMIDRRAEYVEAISRLSSNDNLLRDNAVADVIEDLKTLISRDRFLRKKQNEADVMIRSAESSTGVKLGYVKSEIVGKYAVPPLEVLEKIRGEYDSLASRGKEYEVEIANLRGSINNDAILEELIEVESKIKETLAVTEELKEKRDRLLILRELITVMNERFIGDKKPNFAKKASDMFKAITGQKYSGVYIDQNETIHAQGDMSVEAKSITSTATKEQLFMALKMAVLDEIEKKHESLVVSLDEAFAHWDQERSVNFLKLLGEESYRRQYIFYTCSEAFANDVVTHSGAKLIRLE
jgi:hypothetical protein